MKFVDGVEGLDKCLPLCRRFNPVKFDHFLEGGVEKLNYYSYSLKTLI